MIRLGLCCKFASEPIHFRTTTAAYLKRLQARGENPHDYILQIIRDNCAALAQSIDYCIEHGIGSFRVNSRFCPLSTHPNFAYTFDDLPDDIRAQLARCRQDKIRLTFHPDQFVVINSPRADVVAKSLEELEWYGALAEAIGADVINIHGGGGYGDKRAALDRFATHARDLSPRVRKRLTVENDDKTYTPEELLPLCHKLDIPLVYDVHHHRCHPDHLSVEEATESALQTWNCEPLFHISSPLNGWRGAHPTRHRDYIEIGDVPTCWKDLELTLDVEAKAKELAVKRLRQGLAAQGWEFNT